jgi:hypothetical protein
LENKICNISYATRRDFNLGPRALFTGEKKQIELRKVSEVSTNGFGSGSSSSMSLSSGNGVLEESEEHSADQLRLDHFSFSDRNIPPGM